MSDNETVDVFYIQDMSLAKKSKSVFPLLENDGVPPENIRDLTLQHFLQNEETIHGKMRTRIYEYYNTTRETILPYMATLPNIDEIYPEIITGDEIDSAVHLSAINISPDGEKLRFTYEVNWDVEHGLEIIVYGGQVVDIGPAGEVLFK